MSAARPSAVDWRPAAALAPLLVYPDDDTRARAAYCRDLLAAEDPAPLEIADGGLHALEATPRHELEELYTRTFDLNPVATLEVGWHLYGEQYERGRFLVRAREMLAEVGQDEAGELPDFLPSLLAALPRLGAAAAADLAGILLPAVGKMCEALDAKDGDNPYAGILRAVRATLAARAPEGEAVSLEGRYRPHLRTPKRDLVQLGRSAQGGRGGQGDTGPAVERSS